LPFSRRTRRRPLSRRRPPTVPFGMPETDLSQRVHKPRALGRDARNGQPARRHGNRGSAKKKAPDLTAGGEDGGKRRRQHEACRQTGNAPPKRLVPCSPFVLSRRALSGDSWPLRAGRDERDRVSIRVDLTPMQRSVTSSICTNAGIGRRAALVPSWLLGQPKGGHSQG
jgi:hypothetical protein